MHPVIWSVGKINIYSHGLLVAVGVIAGGILLYFSARRKIPTDLIPGLIFWALTGALVGARLLYFVLYFEAFNRWYELFFLWQGGLVSFGGLAGGLVTAAFYLKYKKQSVWLWFDATAAPFFLGWAIGRVGCFLTGDVSGYVPLYESALSLGITVLVLIFTLGQKTLFKTGLIFAFSLGLYGLGRFMIDFIRDDDLLWQLKLSQIGDLSTVIIAIILVFILYLKWERRAHGFQRNI